MDYLALTKQISLECSISGDGPASVANQIGQTQLIVNWTNKAYEDIQRDSLYWHFRQLEKTFSTVSTVEAYKTEMSDVVEVKQYSVTLYLAKADESFLTELAYDAFKKKYRFGVQATGRPTEYSIHPDGSMLLGPIPDDTYTVNFEYIRTIHSLVNDTDLPIIPQDYQNTIKWKACLYYAGYEEAANQYQVFDKYYKEALSRLISNQKDNIILNNVGLA